MSFQDQFLQKTLIYIEHPIGNIGPTYRNRNHRNRIHPWLITLNEL